MRWSRSPSRRPGLLDHLAHVLDGGRHGRELFEGPAGRGRHDLGQGGLPGPRRPPEDGRGEPVGLDEGTQRPARADQLVLPDDLVERAGPQAGGQRRLPAEAFLDRGAEQVIGQRQHGTASDHAGREPAVPNADSTGTVLPAGAARYYRARDSVPAGRDRRMSTRTRTTALEGPLVLRPRLRAGAAATALAAAGATSRRANTQAEPRSTWCSPPTRPRSRRPQAAVVAAGGTVTAVNTDVGPADGRGPGRRVRRRGERQRRGAGRGRRTGRSARPPRTAARPAGRTSRR